MIPRKETLVLTREKYIEHTAGSDIEEYLERCSERSAEPGHEQERIWPAKGLRASRPTRKQRVNEAALTMRHNAQDLYCSSPLPLDAASGMTIRSRGDINVNAISLNRATLCRKRNTEAAAHAERHAAILKDK